jgi:hypothetical protein
MKKKIIEFDLEEEEKLKKKPKLAREMFLEESEEDIEKGKSYKKAFKSEQPRKYHIQEKVFKDTIQTPSFPSPEYEIQLKKLELSILENQILLEKLKMEDSSREKDIVSKEVLQEEQEEQKEQQELIVPVFPEKKKKRFLFFGQKDKITSVNNIPRFPKIYPSDNVPLKDNDLESIKRCPLCNSKIKKGKVIKEGEYSIQNFVCKRCSFFKQLKFKIIG